MIDSVREFGWDPRSIAAHEKIKHRKSSKWNAIQSDLMSSIKDFYLREDNSRSTSGKKETVTLKKEKRQIHYV